MVDHIVDTLEAAEPDGYPAGCRTAAVLER